MASRFCAGTDSAEARLRGWLWISRRLARIFPNCKTTDASRQQACAGKRVSHRRLRPRGGGFYRQAFGEALLFVPGVQRCPYADERDRRSAREVQGYKG